MTSLQVRPYRPLPIKLGNALGRFLVRTGVTRVRLAENKLLAAARAQTGLSDWGDKSFRQPLGLLLESLEREAHLNFLGRIAARRRLTQMLVNRLQIQEALRRHPDIRAEPIRKPIFILGLPRTGTTLLHTLFLQDPANRVLRFWEGQVPALEPAQRRVDPDPRLGQAEQQLKFFHYLAPQFAAIHPLEADGPQECVTLFANALQSLQFEHSYDIPGYAAWLEQQDLAGVYLYYADQLRLLQWRHAAARWVLKSPAHLFGLDALLATFPDAQIVQTHRDPLRVLASLCSLVAVLRGVTSDRIDPRRIGRQVPAKWSVGLTRALAVRDRAGEERFCDVHFRELVADPLGAVRKIYGRFGLPLNTAVEERMRQTLAANPSDKHGVHRYTLGQFGLDPAVEARRFREYRDRFHIPAEGDSKDSG
jgi:hypothetical protein